MKHPYRVSALICALASALVSREAAANTLRVDSPADDWSAAPATGVGDGHCTLREAVAAWFNAGIDPRVNDATVDCGKASGDDYISLETPPGSTIELKDTIDVNRNPAVARHHLTISSSLGEGAKVQEISVTAGMGKRLFRVAGDGGPQTFAVTFMGLSFEDASVTGGGAAVLGQLGAAGALYFGQCRFVDNVGSGDEGGAVRVEGGYLEMYDTAFLGNQTDRGGAGLWTSAETRLERTVFRDNEAAQGGGGFMCSGPSPTTITSSSFITNRAAGREIPGVGSVGGGAIRADCKLELDGSYLVKNSTAGAAGGGGIFVDAGGDLRVTDSLLSSNESRGDIAPSGAPRKAHGGAIHARGSVSLRRSVLDGNRSTMGDGGGVYANDAFQIANTQITNNTATDLFSPEEPTGLGGGVLAGPLAVGSVVHASISDNPGASAIHCATSGRKERCAMELLNTFVGAAAGSVTCGGALKNIAAAPDTIQADDGVGSATCVQALPWSQGSVLLGTATSELEVPLLDDDTLGHLGDLWAIPFDYLYPQPKSPLLGAADPLGCSAPGVDAVDLFMTPRGAPKCTVGAVETEKP